MKGNCSPVPGAVVSTARTKLGFIRLYHGQKSSGQAMPLVLRANRKHHKDR